MRTRLLAITIASILFGLSGLGASAVNASDAWLVADRSVVAEGRPLWLSLAVGEVFPFAATPISPEQIAELVDLRPGARLPVPGFAPQDGALSLRRPIRGRGLHAFGISMRPEFEEIRSDAFGAYLTAERADRAIPLFAEQSGSTGSVIEKRVRCAKTMVEVLPLESGEEAYSVPIGHPIEIVPLSRPTAWRIGETVQVRVLLDGYAWPDVAVSARCAGWDDAQPSLETRTDAQGIASISLECAGHWFIKAHLARPAVGIGRATWESLWATLTFRVIGHTDVNGDLQAVRMTLGDLSPEGLLGYRMGRCAIETLGLRSNCGALAVIHQSPRESALNSIPMGIRAAVRPDGEAMPLRQENASDADVMTIFWDRSGNRQVVVQLLPSVLEWLNELSPEEAELASLRLAAMPDDEIFVATMLEPPSPASDPDAAPWGEQTAAVAVDLPSKR